MENMHCISLSICIVARIMLRPYFNHAEIIFNLQKLQIFFKIFFLKIIMRIFYQGQNRSLQLIRSLIFQSLYFNRVFLFICLFYLFGSLRLTRFQAAIEASKWQSNCKHLEATAVVILCYINKTQLD